MSLNAYLDDRADRDDRNHHQANRDATVRDWLNQNLAPEVRLVRFDAWLRLELAARLDWAWAGPAKAKRLEQCRLQIDGMILALWRRGWLLDGRRLANRVTGMLDAIGKAQRAGQVRDFWPYFKASVTRYVGLNSEELQAEAMSAGSAISQVLLKLTKQQPSLPELVAQRADETLRAKLTRHRTAEARKSAQKDQFQLL